MDDFTVTLQDMIDRQETIIANDTRILVGFATGVIGQDQLYLVEDNMKKLTENKTNTLRSQRLLDESQFVNDKKEQHKILFERLIELIDKNMIILQASQAVCKKGNLSAH